jgi:hypothetical protein
MMISKTIAIQLFAAVAMFVNIAANAVDGNESVDDRRLNLVTKLFGTAAKAADTAADVSQVANKAPNSNIKKTFEGAKTLSEFDPPDDADTANNDNDVTSGSINIVTNAGTYLASTAIMMTGLLFL